jgi:glycosyltransferase involved in cell wall biosynthesis
VPEGTQSESVIEVIRDGVRVISIKALRTKDIPYIQRVLSEFFNPFLIWSVIAKENLFKDSPIDLVIWYSPSIFWGPLVKRIKKYWGCKTYLVLRDIFPDWAIDLDLLKSKTIAYFLKRVASYQYQQADLIGVQSPANLEYFNRKNPAFKNKAEVLWNWIRPGRERDCSIELKKTILANKRIGVYAGNIGVAQGVEYFLRIARVITENPEFGLVFIGRGAEMANLKESIAQEKIENVLFFDEIDPEEISSLYTKCDFGILLLDPRHKTHNIPGKFISYLRAGMPSFGLVEEGNDLLKMVKEHQIGLLSSDYTLDGMLNAFTLFKCQYIYGDHNKESYKELEELYFNSRKAADQIVKNFL